MKWNLKEIFNLKIEKKEQKSLRMLAIKALGIFLVLMILFTSLSRALDTMTIPKVTQTRPERKSLDSSVNASGRVVQNKEQSISTVSGIDVKSVAVSVGQDVKAGEELFALDLENIQKKIDEINLEIEKMDIQMNDKDENTSIENNKKGVINQRNQEDYNKAVNRGNQEVSKAYNEMIDAWNKLESFRNSGSNAGEGDSVQAALQVTVDEKATQIVTATETLQTIESEVTKTIEDEKIKLSQEQNQPLSETQINDIVNRVNASYQSALTNAQDAIAQAQSGKEQADAALQEYVNSKSAESRKTEEEALLNDYNAKKDTYNTAVQGRDDNVENASRTLQDGKDPSAVDSSNDISMMDREEKVKEVEKLQALIDQNGVVVAPVDGMVTEVGIKTGSATAEGMAVLMADTTDGAKFVAEITKEQQKQIERKDPVVLTPENNGKPIENLTLDMLQPKADNPEMIEATILLPSGVMELGKTAEMLIKKVSEPYATCVPIEAIRQDGNQKYVLVMRENETILGVEYVANRVDVTVLKSNNTYAAIQEGSITGEDRVILSGTKEISAGDRVRLLSE